jgi:hypothetical protein
VQGLADALSCCVTLHLTRLKIKQKHIFAAVTASMEMAKKKDRI